MADPHRTWMVFLTCALVMLAITGSTLMAYAATEGETQPPAEKKVTLQFSNTPVVDAIDLLFKKAGYKYTIEAGVSGNITMRLTDVPFEQALNRMMEATRLEYVTTGGRYVIRPRQKAAGEAPVTPTDGSKEQAAPKQPPSDSTKPDNQGPIYYGKGGGQSQQGPPREEGNQQIVVVAPQTTIIGGHGPGYAGARVALPPPSLIPPSLQRMLAMMAILEPYMRPKLFSGGFNFYSSYNDEGYPFDRY